MKICRTCGETKAITDFFVDRSRKDGYAYRCKECHRRSVGRMLDRDHRAIIQRSRESGLMKTCTKCGERKPVTDFFTHKATTDGFRPDCKACLSAKLRDHYERNKEAIIERQMEYVRRNSEAVKKAHQRSHRRRSQDPEWLAKTRAKSREWERANPEKRALNQQRRLARLANAPVNDFTQRQWEVIKAAYRDRCAYCGIDSKRLCMEHVIPLSRGGPHTAGNIVPSCNPCNTSKGDRPAPPMLVVPLMLRL